jgi:hypothetical protein
MDMKSYYNDWREHCARLKVSHPNNVVYVTSLYHRERNSVAGQTLSASVANAARVITDGTHREATKEEVEAFIQHQNDELLKTTQSEQARKQHYFVVVDPKDVPGASKPAVPFKPTVEPELVGAGETKKK